MGFAEWTFGIIGLRRAWQASVSEKVEFLFDFREMRTKPAAIGARQYGDGIAEISSRAAKALIGAKKI